MENIEVMKAFQAQYDMGKNLPDVALIEAGAIFLVSHDFLVEISIVEKLHYNAKVRLEVPERVGLDEGVLVADDVGRVQRGEDPHLI